MAEYYLKRSQHVLTVGTDPVAFPQSETIKQPEAIMIQGVFENTGRFFIAGDGVQSDYSVGAFVFPPGLADAMLPFVDDENLYIVSTQPNQKIMITYLADKV